MASPEGTLQSFKEYNAHRGVEVYTLKITPQQRAALHKAMVASDATCDEVTENVAYALGRTCAGSAQTMTCPTMLPIEMLASNLFMSAPFFG